MVFEPDSVVNLVYITAIDNAVGLYFNGHQRLLYPSHGFW